MLNEYLMLSPDSHAGAGYAEGYGMLFARLQIGKTSCDRKMPVAVILWVQTRYASRSPIE